MKQRKGNFGVSSHQNSAEGIYDTTLFKIAF